MTMSSQYFIRSLLSGVFVIDVPGSNTTPTTKLHIWKHNGGTNQLWTFEQGSQFGDQNFFFIRSALGHDLVIDIPHSKTTERTPLQTHGKNNGDNQLWTPIDCPESDPNAFSIQSNLGSAIVMDVKGGVAADNTALEIFNQNPASSDNQAWHLDPVSQATFTQQKITSIKVGGTNADGTELVRFVGEGFRPTSSLKVVFSYQDEQGESTTVPSQKARVDFAGGFAKTMTSTSGNGAGVRFGLSGTGSIKIWDNANSSVFVQTIFKFDGSNFQILFSGPE
jgi:hypothetical protein